MYVSMCLIKDRYGTWIVRRKVSERLQEPVARVLDNGKERQAYLQKSSGTKDRREATRLAPAILVEFGKILDGAEALLAERPLRTTLEQSEIDRIADFHYASMLAGDEEFTTEGAKGDEDLARDIAGQLTDADLPYTMPFPLDAEQPAYGLSNRQVAKRDEHLAEWLPIMRAALSRGDISMVSEAMTELLDRCHLNLNPNSPAYRKLGLAVLKAEVRALEALERRSKGEPIDTPSIAHLEPAEMIAPAQPTARPSASAVRSNGAGAIKASSGTLRTAFAGWKKERERAQKTVAEYERAMHLFIELHGDLPIANIAKRHALQFREGLQDLPPSRPRELANMTLPRLIEWRRAHPEGKRLKSETVNKLLGGVQAIAKWGYKNGLIPDDIRWSDPFAEMRLPQGDDQAGGPFEPGELRTLFGSPVFTTGERPKAGRGDVAFWLPLLALFTGARRAELTMLRAADVSPDETIGAWTVVIRADKAAGRTLKTAGSARTIPVHPELVRLGFLDFVERVRRDEGGAGSSTGDMWLFSAVSSAKGANAWTQWFRLYLDKLGITDAGKGLHSLRHNFTDALRTAGVSEDLQDALTGHAGRTVGRSYGARARHGKQRYKVIVDRFGMAQLVETIGKVKYPSIDLQAVRGRSTLLPRRGTQ